MGRRHRVGRARRVASLHSLRTALWEAATLSLLVFCAVSFGAENSSSEPEALTRANLLERDGRFTDAERVLNSALKEARQDPETRAQLEFAKDRLRRIRLDFPLSRAELFAS